MRIVLRWSKTTALVVCLLCCLSGWSAAQVATVAGKTLLLGRGFRIYLVDLAAGTAAVLPITLSADRSIFPSPDLNYMVVGDKTGLTLYILSGAGMKQFKTVAAKSSSDVVWAADAKSFVYTQDIENADGSATVQIHQWDMTTSQSKKLM